MCAERAQPAAPRVRSSGGGGPSTGQNGFHPGQTRCLDVAWYRYMLLAADLAPWLERLAQNQRFFVWLGRGTLSLALNLVRTRLYSVLYFTCT